VFLHRNIIYDRGSMQEIRIRIKMRRWSEWVYSVSWDAHWSSSEWPEHIFWSPLSDRRDFSTHDRLAQ
jgi:hypothetical protein